MPRLGLLVTVAALFALIPVAHASAATFDLEITQMGQGEVTCYVEAVEVDCTESFEEGEEVTLLAQPDPEFELVGFSGDCDFISGEECEVIMEGATPKKVTVTFKRIEYDLTIEAKGSGTGSVACEIESEVKACEKTYPEGTPIVLIAKAGSGSVFAGWGAGDCEAEPSEAECELAMYEDYVVAVTFNSVNSGGSGTVGGSTSPPKVKVVIAGSVAGKAKIAGAGLYKGGKATLRISCKGEGPCKGTVKLIASLEIGHKTKRVTVGQASFNLNAGASKALTVKLSAPAKKLLGKGRTLTVKASGSGVSASTVKIKPTER
ncbi:MAG TPA: hypothetical protein VF245_02290 [Solirubrobacterales bacterium]